MTDEVIYFPNRSTLAYKKAKKTVVLIDSEGAHMCYVLFAIASIV